MYALSRKQNHAAFIVLVQGMNQTQVSNEAFKSWEEGKNVYIYVYIVFLLRYINLCKVWLMKMTALGIKRGSRVCPRPVQCQEPASAPEMHYWNDR